MSLFKNIFGKSSGFRPMNRFEKSDPSLRSLYRKQRTKWESEKKQSDEEYEAYVKEMKRLYGPNWRSILQSQKIEGQRAKRKAEVEKAAEDMRSGKTSRLVGEAAGGPPTFKPISLDTKKAEGPVQVRKAIPQQKVFKAMVSGKPEASQVFDSQEQADKYIQDEYNKRVGGLQSQWKQAIDRGDSATAKKLENQIKTQRMGVVASVRGTPEEMARYKEESTAGQRKQAAFKEEYDKRIRPEATARTEKLRSAMRYYDEATTPEQRAAAKSEIEAARLESATAQSTRGMSEEQKKKFREGLGGVLERRTQRESETEAKTRVARAESREQEKSRVMQKDVTKQISDYKKSLSALKRAYNQARQAGDEFGAFQLLEYIKYFTANVPEDEKKLRDYAMSGRLAEDQKYLRSIAGDQEE